MVHVLFELMLLPKEQVEDLQARRGGEGKEEKKKEKTSWLRKKKK